MAEVTEQDRATAKELRNKLVWEGIDPIARALAAAREQATSDAYSLISQAVHARGVLDCTDFEKGPVVRKVCGQFILTADGAIACEEGDCWAVVRSSADDPWVVRECRRSGNPEDYGCWWEVDDWSDFGGCDIASVWSTPAAAESARPTP